MLAALLSANVAASAAAAPLEVAEPVPAFAQQFVVAAGEQAAVMGSAADGLEAWSWPLQLFSGWRVRFREPGRVDPLDGASLLRRVERRGAEVVRVYVGPDFTVRERLFAPLHAQGVVLDYEVEGRPDVRIEAHFRPSLDLMWPGALGGQSAQWDPARGGYVEREPVHGFSALIRSPETVAHEAAANTEAGPHDLALVLAPRAAGGEETRRAQVFVTAGDGDTGALSAQLEAQSPQLRTEAAAHGEAVLERSLRIVTPDPTVNRALADAELALDQAWVCAPGLGCGEVGGYGPSRPGRRPQYAWFFAGDGLVATEGLIATGRFERAREELDFIARRQNPANGMIWHELSLSAPLIDWERRYPYMFVHVDITYQYLATLADYATASGDRAFLQAHWPGIEAAWRYGRSLLDPATGLPTIPPGKQGQNEQARLRDDVRLSSAFLDAADGYARVARALGRPAQAAEAQAAADRARRALASGAWDPQRGFWVGGHTVAGAPAADARSDAARLLEQGVFTPGRTQAALDKLVSPEFQTDWGVRSLSAADPAYDPNPYAQGAVWGLGTATTAGALWAKHRPFAAWAAWRGLAAWNTLDTPGRLHEVLAGDLYHPELESVPAQTWSSAGLLSSAVHGLFGLEVDGDARRLVFAPNLPATWGEARLEGLRVGDARLTLATTQDAGATTLVVTAAGPPVALDFAPALPLGARLTSAEVDGRPLAATVAPIPEDPRARMALTVHAGATRIVVRYVGGVRLAPPVTPPRAGDPSRNLRVGAVSWRDGRLTVAAWAADPARAQVGLLTTLTPSTVTGGALTPAAGGYTLTFASPPAAQPGAYAPVKAEIAFTP